MRKGDSRVDLEDRRDEVARLTRQGATASELAQKFNTTTRAIQRDKKARGCVGAAAVPMTGEERSRAYVLLSNGASCADVAVTLRRNPKTIRQRFPQYAWTRKQIGEYSSMRRQMMRLHSKGKTTAS